MTAIKWTEETPHHVSFAKSRRATVLFHHTEIAIQATLIGDDGVVGVFYVVPNLVGAFMQKLQVQHQGGSLVFGWGLMATGGLGPRPGGPPGPTGEPPLIKLANMIAHNNVEVLAEATFANVGV